MESAVWTLMTTGKSLSEALIFVSTNPQYDNRLFIELQVQYMKVPSSNLRGACCVQKLFLTFRTIFAHNRFAPCSAKRRASDKDLPVLLHFKAITFYPSMQVVKIQIACISAEKLAAFCRKIEEWHGLPVRLILIFQRLWKIREKQI